MTEDIVCHAPAGRLAGAAAFREFMGPFVRMVTSSITQLRIIFDRLPFDAARRASGAD